MGWRNMKVRVLCQSYWTNYHNLENVYAVWGFGSWWCDTRMWVVMKMNLKDGGATRKKTKWILMLQHGTDDLGLKETHDGKQFRNYNSGKSWLVEDDIRIRKVLRNIPQKIWWKSYHRGKKRLQNIFEGKMSHRWKNAPGDMTFFFHFYTRP